MVMYPSTADAPSTTWDDLVRQHADFIFATCHRVLGNRHETEDATQEVLLKWWQGRERQYGHLPAWLHRVARGVAIDRLRRQVARTRAESTLPIAGDSIDPIAPLLSHLDEALSELPEVERELLLDHHGLGVSQAELAHRHRCHPATISRRLHEGRASLAQQLSSRIGALAAASLTGLLVPGATAEDPGSLLPGGPCPALQQMPMASVAGSAAPRGAHWFAVGAAAVLIIAVLPVLGRGSDATIAPTPAPVTQAQPVVVQSSAPLSAPLSAPPSAALEDWNAWVLNHGQLDWDDPVSGHWRRAAGDAVLRAQGQAWLDRVTPAVEAFTSSLAADRLAPSLHGLVQERMVTRPVLDHQDATSARLSWAGLETWLDELIATSSRRVIIARGLANALAWRTVLGGDPATALTQLDQFIKAYDRHEPTFDVDVLLFGLSPIE